MSQPPYPPQPQGFPQQPVQQPLYGQNPPPAYLGGGAPAGGAPYGGAPYAGGRQLPPPPPNKPRSVGLVVGLLVTFLLLVLPLIVLVISQAD